MYRGRRSGDETVDEDMTKGIFKGNINIYKWSQFGLDYVTNEGYDLVNGTFQSLPSNEPLNFVVRAYFVKGSNLKPKDTDGTLDAYLVLNLGKQRLSDRDNYVPKEVNPIWGK